ncbi:sigma-70 family RNA polymerase sigma factor [Inconstantimicrobium mannanitabidum]|uniref:RNA polymerase sigma factor n=1 Tax=Inconstantimicrobium mannanitabidum TaxID=1604901 RepID=A0ACB5RGH4_9CLOT|nr:sigma-70 family RNA polymerase sigma factor [Clostridium sp. TW13]GKX68190.1 RNA polymerase sigma factor [Clostridium sp. TW13]
MIDENNFIQALMYKDFKALDYLVDKYSDLGLKVSYSILNNRELSEECTNDALLKVWNNIGSFKGDSESFAKWFVVITKRQAIDILRKEKKHSCKLELKEELAYSLEDTAFEAVNKKLERQSLSGCLEKLDEGSKDIITRRYFKDESVAEISTDLGISKSAVSNKLLRIKKKLKHVFMEEIYNER